MVVEIIGPEVSSGGAVTGFRFRIESSPRDQKFLPLDNNFEEFINALRSVKFRGIYIPRQEMKKLFFWKKFSGKPVIES